MLEEILREKKCLCASDVRSFPSCGDRCLHKEWLTIPHIRYNHPHIIPPLNSSLCRNEWLLTNTDHYGNGGGRLDGHREGESENHNTAHQSSDSLIKGKNNELLQMSIYVRIHDLHLLLYCRTKGLMVLFETLKTRLLVQWKWSVLSQSLIKPPWISI
jgi:hypothetical protein